MPQRPACLWMWDATIVAAPLNQRGQRHREGTATVVAAERRLVGSQDEECGGSLVWPVYRVRAKRAILRCRLPARERKVQQTGQAGYRPPEPVAYCDEGAEDPPQAPVNGDSDRYAKGPRGTTDHRPRRQNKPDGSAPGKRRPAVSSAPRPQTWEGGETGVRRRSAKDEAKTDAVF